MSIREANEQMGDIILAIHEHTPELAVRLATAQTEINEAWRAYCKRIAAELMEEEE